MIVTVPEESSAVLSSWKDIARYLGKGVRTVQRWEQHHGLPVRRPAGAASKSAVLLNRTEVDEWLVSRFSRRVRPNRPLVRENEPSALARSSLREGIRTTHELRMANQALTAQICDSIRTLTERCDLLISRSKRVG
jgi:hypothetical protein